MTHTGPPEFQTHKNSAQKLQSREILTPPESQILDFRDFQGGTLGAQKVKMFDFSKSTDYASWVHV